LNLNWRSRRWVIGEVDDRAQISTSAWIRLALCLAVTLALLLVLAALPHPW